MTWCGEEGEYCLSPSPELSGNKASPRDSVTLTRFPEAPVRSEAFARLPHCAQSQGRLAGAAGPGERGLWEP